MAAPQPNSNAREILEFAPNVTITLALKYASGKIVSGARGERVLYTCTDGRIFFVDPPVAGQIERLGVNVREPFQITKRWDGKKDSPFAWDIARPGAPSPHGTLEVPKLPEAATPKPPQRATASTLLINEANALVDAYAEVLARTLTKHEGRIKPDEARSLLITAYIQRSKLSSVA
jgi:hypothetical protein